MPRLDPIPVALTPSSESRPLALAQAGELVFLESGELVRVLDALHRGAVFVQPLTEGKAVFSVPGDTLGRTASPEIQL